MIQILIRPGLEVDTDPDAVEQVVRSTLEAESVTAGVSLTVVISDDTELQSLNEQYRGIDAPTDVLAFADEAPDERFIDASDDPPYLGDVVISHTRACAQAAERGHSTWHEMRLLIVHGVLHLLGYDHGTEAERAAMWGRQGAILGQVE